jgi:hypothetical protein
MKNPSKRWSWQSAIKEAVKSFRKAGAAAPEESLQELLEKASALLNGIGDPGVADLVAAGVELARATLELLELIAEPEFSDADFLLEATELRAAYDEYLELLQIRIDSMPPESDSSAATSDLSRDDLALLQAGFDQDRTLLTTIIDFVQSDLFAEEEESRRKPAAFTRDPLEPGPNGTHDTPSENA